MLTSGFIRAIALISLAMISRLAVAFPPNGHHHSHQGCDCSTKTSRRAAIDPSVITCDRVPTDTACPNLIKQLVWRTRKDSLLRSSTIDVLDMIQQELPSSVIVTDFDIDLIGESFYQQLPRTPDLILSDVSVISQIRHLRQMQASILNSTALVRKFLRSLDHPRAIYRSNVPHQYYQTLEFALVHVYCPISHLLGVISSGNPNLVPEELPSSPPADAAYVWECPSKKHCLEMERTMLRRLNEIYDQITKNFSRIQESAACA